MRSNAFFVCVLSRCAARSGCAVYALPQARDLGRVLRAHRLQLGTQALRLGRLGRNLVVCGAQLGGEHAALCSRRVQRRVRALGVRQAQAQLVAARGNTAQQWQASGCDATQ